MVVHSILLRCLAQDEKCVKAVSLCFHLWHCLIQSVFDFSIFIYVFFLVFFKQVFGFAGSCGCSFLVFFLNFILYIYI